MRAPPAASRPGGPAGLRQGAERPLTAVDTYTGLGRPAVGFQHRKFIETSFADRHRPLIVAYRHGAPIRLADVASVADSVEDIRTLGLADTQDAVLLIIFRQPKANIIDTVDRVRALLPELAAEIPPAMKLDVVMDRTTTIRASVHDVQVTLMISIGLVILVVFLFLRNVRATLIPAVAVPISLVVRNSDNEFPARAAGATSVINPVSFAGLLLAGTTQGSGIADYMADLASAGGRVRLHERTVEAFEIGKSLSDVAIGLGLRILRGNTVIGFWEEGAKLLQRGDKIIEVIPDEAFPKVPA